MAREFAERYPDVGHRRVLHNARFIDAALKEPAPGSPPARPLTVGFIGRLDEPKGFDVALALMGRFADDARIRFVVAGDQVDTPFRDEIAAAAARLGDRVEFRGFVSGATKSAFFADIDVLAFPSKYINEASPMVCYEALARGVPVLATDVGAVRDIVDATCGRLFEPSPELAREFGDALAALIDDPARLVVQRGAARHRFEVLHARSEAEMAELRAALS
jgi:glycosyltransferase involved in cell wall biosynthesis